VLFEPFCPVDTVLLFTVFLNKSLFKEKRQQHRGTRTNTNKAKTTTKSITGTCNAMSTGRNLSVVLRAITVKRPSAVFCCCKTLDIGFSEDGGKCNRAKFVEVYVTDDAGGNFLLYCICVDK